MLLKYKSKIIIMLQLDYSTFWITISYLAIAKYHFTGIVFVNNYSKIMYIIYAFNVDGVEMAVVMKYPKIPITIDWISQKLAHWGSGLRLT